MNLATVDVPGVIISIREGSVRAMIVSFSLEVTFCSCMVARAVLNISYRRGALALSVQQD